MIDAYEAFGRTAELVDSATVMAGRGAFQAASEALIADDIRQKMKLDAGQRLLEIGCGAGALLVSLAQWVDGAVGIDHPSVLAKFRQRGVPANVLLVEGRWPQVAVSGTFDRIVAYSVLHYVPDGAAAHAFVEAALEVLRPGGVLMLGDIPNEDARSRFLATRFGQDSDREYRKMRGMGMEEERRRDQIFAAVGPTVPFLNDAFVMEFLRWARRRGTESYLLPQDPRLPLSYTREDLLIWKRP